MSEFPVSSAPNAEEAPQLTSAPRAGGTGPSHQNRVPFWAQIVPFVFSAILFLSGFFSIFSPLPILLAFFRSGRRLGWIAAVTNTLIVGLLGGPSSAVFFAILVATMALALAEALSRRRSIEKAAAVALVAVALAGVAGLGIYAKVHHWQNPWAEVKQQVSTTVDEVMLALQGQKGDGTVSPESTEQVSEVKETVTRELPSYVAILVLMMVWANLLLLVRLNPVGLRQSLALDPFYFQRWKTPEWLVWPTIVAGFFLLVEVRGVTPVALNVFRILMALYALQGLSILSALFQSWHIRGAFRTLGFLVVIFAMMPLLLGLGFFDLWFDFRSKFRQS